MNPINISLLVTSDQNMRTHRPGQPQDPMQSQKTKMAQRCPDLRNNINFQNNNKKQKKEQHKCVIL